MSGRGRGADGTVELYRPRWPEWLLGIGGLGAAFVLTMIGVRTPPSKGDCLERSKSTEGLSVRGIQPLSAT